MTAYRANHFKDGYSAEYVPPGQTHFRFVLDEDRKPKVFPSLRAALEAAKEAYAPRVGKTLEEEALAFMKVRHP